MASSSPIEIPQWGSDADWQEANRTFRHLLRRHADALEPLLEIAHEIKNKLESLFPTQNDVCRETCVDCSSPCCVTATVWFDFCDVLFMNLLGLPIPEHQLIERQIDSCRYHSHTGCVLPRLTRPWVCTLYFCPPQMAILRNTYGDQKPLIDETIASIKKHRKMLEELFLSLIR